MPDIAPPPKGRSSSLRGVTIGAFVLAAIFALTTGLALYAATHRPMPPTVLVDRAVAGWDANCGTSAQIAVDFATDHEMAVHVDLLRTHLDVVDIYAARQRENGGRHRMLLRALAAGPEGYEALVRDEDQPATVWLRLAGGTDDAQFADVLRAELGSAAQAVRVDVPCLTVNALRDQVDRLRDYPTRCLTPTTDPAGQLEIPAGCPPIP